MRKALLLTLLLLMPAISQAWMFEPGIGYNRGHFSTSKLQGIGLSVKLGAEFNKFFVVGDVGYHDLQLGSTPTSTQMDMGATIGGDFGKFRFWFSYLLAASVEFESGATTQEYAGDGIKLGLSGNIKGKTYLNLEVRFIDINELNGTPTTQFLDAAFLSVSWKIF